MSLRQLLFFTLSAALIGSAPRAGIAQDMLPALYDVAGVEAADVLNVRAEASANAAILGQLPPDQPDVEVVSLTEDGRWGRVNIGEINGWVWMEFLARHSNQAFTEPNRCFGVEPFWSLTFDSNGGTTFTKLGETGQRQPQLSRVGSTAGEARMGYVMSSDGYALIGVVSREICSDGMSDQVYGFGIDLMEMGGRNNRRLYTGCCSVAPR